jgi:signal transduction histidine kinase
VVFCFVIFTVFAALIYRSVFTTFINGEYENVEKSTKIIEQKLSLATKPLTVTSTNRLLVGLGEEEDDKVDIYVMPNIYNTRRQFTVYSLEGKVLFTTYDTPVGLDKSKSQPTIIRTANHYGYLVSKPIISKTKSRVVGYVQSYYSLDFYEGIKKKVLFNILLIVAFALMISSFIGFLMSQYLVGPLAELAKAMKKISENPSEKVEPIEIKTGDEIEELGDVFNEMNQKTGDYIEMQKRFVSDVSHELRTPVAVLEGHIGLLNRWGKDDPEVLNESLQASADEVHKMKVLITDMLAFTRLQSVFEEHKHDITDLDRMNIGLIKNFRMINPDYHINYDVLTTEGSFGQIYDAHYEQAMTILMENARKYRGDGQKVLDIKLTEDAQDLIVSVKDYGLGMEEKDIKHIFERFYRADQARHREVGGSGLGLSFLSNIMNAYNGRIEVSSEVGQGSTFTLYIPKVNLADNAYDDA